MVQILRSSFASFRANLGAAVVIQCLALAIVLAYFFHDGAREVLASVGAWHAGLGLVGAMATTALFGGLLPWLVQRWFLGEGAGRQPGLWFVLLFWAYKGIEILVWYTTQSLLWGDGIGFGTLAAKVALDQFVLCPLFAIPVFVLLFHWEAQGFSIRAARAALPVRWYREKVLPTLVSTWLVWVPGAFLIYALPRPLQMPVQNLGLCLYVLIVTFQNRTPVAQPPGLIAAKQQS